MLPITRVALFKHGVGSYRRSGRVTGDSTIVLSFKASQMNDVLKSLTALDYSGGSFGAVGYDSEDPAERRLAELNLSVPMGGAVARFLDQLKGATVAIPAEGGEVRVGKIVGIELVWEGRGEDAKARPHLVILGEGGWLQRTPLLELDRIQLRDESLQRDLETLLDIQFSGLRKDRKRLTLQALGEGEREISLSYVIEAPVWKTSYRVVLPQTGEEPRALLQGWALVDNTTDDDWEGVSLSLVAGLPISFIHDLYTARYQQRPTVEVQREAAVAPPVVESGAGIGGGGEGAMPCVPAYGDYSAAEPPRARRRRGGGAPKTSGAPPKRPPAPRPMAAAMRDSVNVQTHTQELGDLFAYEIGSPVDVRRGCSALVPILQREAALRRVALYNPELRARNPMSAFRLENDTGLTLEGGPVTVFEGEHYVGEAMLDTVRPKQLRFVPYSVELGVTAKREQRGQQERSSALSKRGQYVYKHFRTLLITEYRFQSQLDAQIELYLDHRYTHDARAETPEPVERTDSFWRFRVELPPGEETLFRVTEVSEQRESVSVPGIARTTIHQLSRQGLIDERVKSELEEIAAQSERIASLRAQVKRAEDRVATLERGQGRLRDNLTTLGSNPEEARLRKRYVAKLTSQEDELEALRAEARDASGRIRAETETLNQMVARLRL